MALTYTRARTVEAGDKVSAADMASLAAAFNDRLLGGLGDPVWRICFYLYSGLFRKVRNDDGTLSTPEAEFFNIYQMLDAEDAAWPPTPSGLPGGVNLANHLNAYISGSEALGIESERARIATIPVDIEGRPEGVALLPSQMWQIAKAQRGAFDPNSGAYGSPMFDLALTYGYVRGSLTSPHGTGWGGYMPTAEDIGGCAAVGDYYPPNLIIKFTNLSSGAVVTYSGTCPEDPTGVAWISYTPYAYLVFLNDGTMDYYAKSEWLEGPYTTDARLTKTAANAIARAQSEFAAEFRGDETQRLERDGGQSHAFLLQEFLTRQYALAPQAGIESGDAVIPVYVNFRTDASGGTTVAPDTAMALSSGGDSYTQPEGSVCHGFLLYGRDVFEGITLDVYDGETLVKTITRTAPNTGELDEIILLNEDAQLFTPMRVVLRNGVRFQSTDGYVMLEPTALLEYKPQIHDYYAVCRVSSYNGDFVAPDGRGIDEPASREIGNNILDYGVVIGITGTPPFGPPGIDPPINQNAVFDAARKMSECIRIIPRWQFRKYAVTGGKSVLWFARYAYGLSNDTPCDLFKYLGPNPETIPSGELVRGRTYDVSVAPVFYNGAQYNPGQSFTAGTVLEYTGAGEVREADGIRSTAEPGGYTNRWCVDVTFRPYHPSTSSIWKPDAHADVVSPFTDRCTMDSPESAYDNNVLLHVAYGVRPTYLAENPSGFRYQPTPLSVFGDFVNQVSCGGDPTCEANRANFYKSCRVFEPAIEIESAERVYEDGEERVKLTLTGRLHYHEDAPASISEDISTWNLTDLTTEAAEYRTIENGLREYLVNQGTGANCDRDGQGNFSANSTIRSDPDNPYGACYPNFLFCKLIPEPYLDGNTSYQSTDSPLLSDHLRLCELYLRAMCEGFVDGRTSSTQACDNSTVTWYDYTYENLMFDATGNRWQALLPSDIRTDNPYGFGPMPMTYLYADVFNGLSAAVNLLDTCRVMLPYTLQLRTLTSTRSTDVTDRCLTAAGDSVPGTWTNGSSDWAVYLQAAGGTGGTETDSGWADGTTGSVFAGVSLDVQSPGSPTTVTELNTTAQLQWRWAETEDEAFAVPSLWSSLLGDNAAVLMQLETWDKTISKTLVSGASNGTQCSSVGPDTVWADGLGNAVLWAADESTHVFSCTAARTVDSGPAPGGLAWNSDQEPDVDGTEFCLDGPQHTINVTAITSNTPAVTVPLVTYSGGS